MVKSAWAPPEWFKYKITACIAAYPKAAFKRLKCRVCKTCTYLHMGPLLLFPDGKLPQYNIIKADDQHFITPPHQLILEPLDQYKKNMRRDYLMRSITEMEASLAARGKNKMYEHLMFFTRLFFSLTSVPMYDKQHSTNTHSFNQ